MSEVTPFRPNWISPPGETIADLLEEASWSQAEFAERMGTSRKFVNQLISGEASLTDETAVKLERVFGSSVRFWLAREAIYRAELAKQEEMRGLQEDVPWLREIPVSDMIALGWVPKCYDKAEQVAECLKFFGVGSVSAWRQWSQSLAQTAYRMSPKAQQRLGATAAWLRYGEIEAKSLVVEPYDRGRFKAALARLRSLTQEPDPAVFLPALRDICASAGVAVVLAPAPRGCPASGATRWLSPSKALMMLSLRYKTNDQLWFSIFHEAAHILLHGKRMMFLEVENGMDADAEREADAFAADALIPREFVPRLAALGANKEKVRRFARELGIAPGIVVGRLQKEGYIPWSHLNGLKVRYSWAGDC
ncbi:MAG TPA: helix-turn-helix domain-containing protein [Pseudomonadales bacterium]